MSVVVTWTTVSKGQTSISAHILINGTRTNAPRDLKNKIRSCFDYILFDDDDILNIGPRSHLNLISSVLDANWIYGSDKETADSLRSFKGGLLKSTPMFRQHGLKDLLPLKLENPDDGCIRATPDTYCFMAGINICALSSPYSILP